LHDSAIVERAARLTRWRILRSRWNLERGFGFHPAEGALMPRSTSSFIRRCLFLALAWGVIAKFAPHQSAIQSPVLNVFVCRCLFY